VHAPNVALKRESRARIDQWSPARTHGRRPPAAALVRRDALGRGWPRHQTLVVHGRHGEYPNSHRLDPIQVTSPADVVLQSAHHFPYGFVRKWWLQPDSDLETVVMMFESTSRKVIYQRWRPAQSMRIET
jgi:hypothetical protein